MANPENIHNVHDIIAGLRESGHDAFADELHRNHFDPALREQRRQDTERAAVKRNVQLGMAALSTEVELKRREAEAPDAPTHQMERIMPIPDDLRKLG